MSRLVVDGALAQELSRALNSSPPTREPKVLFLVRSSRFYRSFALLLLTFRPDLIKVLDVRPVCAGGGDEGGERELDSWKSLMKDAVQQGALGGICYASSVVLVLCGVEA